jgi:multicomponent Na+:H+ antiporter subunit D
MEGLEWLAGVVVLLPLVAAVVPIAASVRYRRIGWGFTALTLGVTFSLAAVLAAVVVVAGEVRYELGGIAAPYGIELFADEFTVVIVLLDSLVAGGVLVYTRTAGPRGNAFYSGYLLLIGSMLGITLTGDLFNLYVFLEIMGISSYALVATADDRWSTYAALKYLLVGTVGATFYLLGVAFAFAATGTLNMRDLAIRLEAVGYTDPLVVAAFVLLTVGLAIKIALFPVHTWLADAHAAAPDGISAVISALVPAVAVYAFSRVLFTVFTIDFLAANPLVTRGLIYGALLSLVAGSLFALLQRKIKLVLAYSTVSQFGLVVAGVAIANETAAFGAILQMFGHGLVKGALFVLAGMFALRFGARSLDEYAGLAKRAPVMAAAFVALGIAMVGLPPTVGFVGKWYIALGAIQEGFWGVAVLVVVSTLLSLGYVVPFVDRLYFRPFDGEFDEPAAVTRWMVVAVVLAAGLGLALGLVSASIEEFLRAAVEELLAPAQ